jgi:hypothetical protein
MLDRYRIAREIGPRAGLLSRKGTTMKPLRILLAASAAFVLAALAPRPAGATFHEMQIEQVIGGVNGLTSVQAVQLRMRIGFQNLVHQARLVVRDATGSNPVVLIAFSSDVTGTAAGSTILAASANFASATTPSVTPDFVFTNPIPDSYLAAGTLTYEDNFGDVLWRLSWGGASYTGPGTGLMTNDLDGQFNPPFAGPLPSSTSQAILFQGLASDMSTNNAADYALTAGAATFTNNGGGSGTINSQVGVTGGSSAGAFALEAPAPNPVRGALAYAIVLPREMRVRIRVVDLEGRVVRTVADRTLAAGRHTLNWQVADRSGPSLSSGVYFLEASGGGFRQARRFVLISG